MSTETTLEDERKRLWDEQEAADNGTTLNTLSTTTQQTDTNPQAAADAAAVQETAAPNGQAAEGEKVETDPYAGLPQVVRDELAGLRVIASRLEGRLRSTEAHVGGIKSQLKQQREMASAITDRGGDAPTAAEITAAQGSSNAMSKLKQDYPEFGAVLEAALQERLGSKQEPQEHQQTQQQDAQPSGGLTQADIDVARAEAFIEARHEGWKEKTKTPAFQGWFERQPREVQMLGKSTDPHDAVRLLDLHRDSMGGQRRTNDLPTSVQAAAALHQTRGGGFQGTKGIEQMTPEEYWKHLDAMEANSRS